MNKELFKKDFQIFIRVFPVLIIYLVVMQLAFKTTCPIYAIYHFPCPGCGLTRSGLAILRLNFPEAIKYNATIFLWILTIVLFIIDRYFKSLKIKPFPTIFIIVSIITLLYYIVRLKNGTLIY